jgi:hypothetical protein
VSGASGAICEWNGTALLRLPSFRYVDMVFAMDAGAGLRYIHSMVPQVMAIGTLAIDAVIRIPLRPTFD